MQVGATNLVEGNEDGDQSRRQKQQLQNVQKQIADDPRIRSLAHEWLDFYIYEQVKTLDGPGPDGALLPV